MGVLSPEAGKVMVKRGFVSAMFRLSGGRGTSRRPPWKQESQRVRCDNGASEGDPWPHARRCDATQVTDLRPLKKLRRLGVFQGDFHRRLRGATSKDPIGINWPSTFDWDQDVVKCRIL
ncbi:unnamed protein product [Durusdinium trenchii]|uniref:Uncharacterized protein n=1 Tax=Durusdinium trenchii TaxID=1381693 RepID=A0ABP0I9L2_9DINO